ncbi:AEC family transporter [Oceanobacter mangrovi]|uniref:AEC family transporter n=1 Tax=Oceanobacter mangrovi TaxID=2862510 RepID=UPI001C8E1BAF|nr:AEC family transporter [Oceanobacter mangrovi]
MLAVLAVTTPIFLLIATGFLIVRRGVIKASEMPTLGRLVTSVALPALIFYSLSQRNFSEVINPVFLLAYGFGSLLLFVAVLWFCHNVRKQPLVTSVLNAMASSCCNSGFIGFPLVLALLGPITAVALALCMIIENVLIIPLGLALSEWSQHRNRPIRESVGKTMALLAKSPISLSIVAGLLASFLQLPIPAPVFKAVEMAAGASGAIALFTIGGKLAGLSLRGLGSSWWEIIIPTVGKLVLHPLIMILMLMILPPFDPQLQVAAVAMACSPMLSIYPILAAQYNYDGTAAATLLVATIVSFFTISLAFWLFDATHFVQQGASILPTLFLQP